MGETLKTGVSYVTTKQLEMQEKFREVDVNSAPKNENTPVRSGFAKEKKSSN